MSNELLVEAATRLFGDTCTHQAVQAAERDGWAPEVWEAASEAGFPWVSVPEEGGGSGGTLADAADLLRVAGAHAAPIPLAETGMLAGWLLAGAGLAIPSGVATVVPGRPDDTVALAGNKVRGPRSRATRPASSRT
jgi:acyl-CoA dehydrogenase